MKILLIPWGRGLGHITRCLALAAEAVQDVNVRVSIVAEADWEPFIIQTGCTRETLPLELMNSDPWRQWADPHYLRQSLAADLALLDKVQPDIVVHDVHFSTLIACDLAHLPCVTLVQYNMYPGFLFPEERFSPFWDQKFASFQEVLHEYGLPPLQHDLRELFFRYPILIPSIPEFETLPVEQNQDRIWYTGPLLYQPFPDLAPDLPTLSTRMPVIFVYGMIHTYEELDRLLVPLRETPCHLLITALPPEMQAATYSDHQLLVTLAPFLDVTQILPMCEAAIIHGGHGSCMALLSAGIPAVVLPNAYLPEQVYNGKRLEDMGIAQCIVDETKWERVYTALQSIREDPIYRKNAKSWQQRLKIWTGAKMAWDILTRHILPSYSSIRDTAQ